ncbi:signal recognition particle GTPase [Staphylococcus gallinarum]|uniref:Signal recognition particle GTPase n=1 Tax=Staphylococcus gallinarum TaxID=1293 RepID=A0A380FER9_STAGA|nr:signal recognition particle GTPase [Staphylococcus gallinarum]
MILQPFNPESYVYGLFADMIEQNVEVSEDGDSELTSDQLNTGSVEGRSDEPK